MISLLQTCPLSQKITILEQDAGLHFLVKVDTQYTDAQLTARLAAAGIRIQALSSYYHDGSHGDAHLFVVNYSALDEDALEQVLGDLGEL